MRLPSWIHLLGPSLLSFLAVALGAACRSETAPASPASVAPEEEPGPVRDAEASPPPGPPVEAGADASPPEWTPPVLPTTSPGCGSGPETVEPGATHTTAAGRTFHVWAPAGYDRTKTWPVVLMFHGIGTTGADFQSWFEMEKYVRGAAIVVYPDAMDGYWRFPGAPDLALFDDMTKQLGDTYCVDPSRVLAFGFSYGAYFASYLGCNRAGYVKAIAAGAGGGGGSNVDCGRLPVLVTNRTVDPDEAIGNGRAHEATWAKLNECADGKTAPDAMNCVSRTSCRAPGSVMFCEDTHQDPSWEPLWNHTVREEYRQLVWDWFAAMN